MSDYLVTWERLGRGTPPPPQTIRDFDPVPADTAAHRLAETVFHLARPRLVSRDIDVTTIGDPECTPTVEIYVYAGFQCVGKGSLRKL